MNPLFAAIPDVAWTVLFAAIAGGITALVNWFVTRAAATEQKAAALVAAKLIADKQEEMKKTVEDTHKVVNSRVDEFKELLTKSTESSVKAYKELLAKAAAFDTVPMRPSPSLPPPLPAATAPTEVVVVNPSDQPVPVKPLK